VFVIHEGVAPAGFALVHQLLIFPDGRPEAQTGPVML